jgi:hypothetical protein
MQRLVSLRSSRYQYCSKKMPALEKFYKNRIFNKAIVVYVNLDTGKAAFEPQYKNKPSETFFDFKCGETRSAKDYYRNATPTYILMEQNHKILLHP